MMLLQSVVGVVAVGMGVVKKTQPGLRDCLRGGRCLGPCPLRTCSACSKSRWTLALVHRSTPIVVVVVVVALVAMVGPPPRLHQAVPHQVSRRTPR